jgi:dTDP-4-dehydrorhamnose reductase
MKILLFGKNGQVGWELQRALAPLGEVIALGSPNDAGPAADFSDAESLAATVRAVAPRWIVNAAAYTAVDRAESEPDRARAINATAPGVLAQEAAAIGAGLIHYSTDYVFDGSGSTPWVEDAETGPLGVYGATKLEGEEAIRRSGCAHLILRTSWVYAARGSNFAQTMLKLAQERDALKVIDDQIGAPTGADLLADVTAHALRRATRQPPVVGTYHVAAAGHTSWHGYAVHVIEQARARGLPIRVAPTAIAAVPTGAFPTAARRPGNSRMDTRKLRDTFDLHLPAWQSGVDRLLAEILD